MRDGRCITWRVSLSIYAVFIIMLWQHYILIFLIINNDRNKYVR
jgi:hypothetical protein